MDSIQGSLTQGSGLAFLTVVRGRRVASKPRDRASSRPIQAVLAIADSDARGANNTQEITYGSWNHLNLGIFCLCDFSGG